MVVAPEAQAAVAAPETSQQSQPAVETPAVVVAEAVKVEAAETKDLSPEAKFNARFATRKAEKAAAAQQPRAEVAAEPVAKPEAEAVAAEPVQEADGAAKPEAAEEKPKLPHRISPRQFDAITQEAIVLHRDLRAEDPSITLKDAIIIVERQHEEAKTKAAEAKAPKPEPAKDLVAEAQTKAETRLSDLRSKRKDLAKDGALYSTELSDVDSQIEDTISEISDLKAERRIEDRLKRQTEEQQQRQALEAENAELVTGFEKSKQDAIDVFPDLGVEGSELFDAANAEAAKLTEAGSPILGELDAPEQVALRAIKTLAGKHGITVAEAMQKYMAVPKAKAAAPKAEVPVPPIQAPKVKPASGAASNAPVQKPQFTAWDSGKAIEERIRQRSAEIRAQRAKSAVSSGISF